MEPVSASVADGLMRSLQTEIDALREENIEQGSHNDELRNEVERLKVLSEEQAAEIERLSALLKASQQSLKAAQAAPSTTSAPAPAPAPAPAAAPPPAAIAANDEELGLLVAKALDEALGGSSFEEAAGAARRRANPAAQGVVAAAVRTAKRAQATWAAEHARLKEEAFTAQKSESSRSAELAEAQEAVRRLTRELGSSRRALQEVQQRNRHLELQGEHAMLLPALPSGPALAAPTAAPEARPPASKFAAYMEELGGAQRPPAKPRRPPPDRLLPALATPPPTEPASVAVNAANAARSMTDALQRQWRQHLNSHMSHWPSGGGRRMGSAEGQNRDPVLRDWQESKMRR